MTTTQRPRGTAPGTDEIDLGESVAGEEVPGAAIEVGMQQTAKTPAPLRPSDEAPAGTPGTGEELCPDCGGSGKQGGRDCPTCQGTGKVTVGSAAPGP